MNNREFFNSIAEKWDNTVNHDEAKIKHILDLVQIKKGSTILDVGTGTGIMVPFMHSYIGDLGMIIAVDVAENMIEVAKKKFNFANVQFIAGDVLQIDFVQKSFDIIMCYSMFPHFEDKLDAIIKLSKYLKVGGKLVICHSQSRDAINKLHSEANKVVQNDRLPHAGIIKEYFSQAGLYSLAEVDNEYMFVIVGIK